VEQGEGQALGLRVELQDPERALLPDLQDGAERGRGRPLPLGEQPGHARFDADQGPLGDEALHHALDQLSLERGPGEAAERALDELLQPERDPTTALAHVQDDGLDRLPRGDHLARVLDEVVRHVRHVQQALASAAQLHEGAVVLHPDDAPAHPLARGREAAGLEAAQGRLARHDHALVPWVHLEDLHLDRPAHELVLGVPLGHPGLAARHPGVEAPDLELEPVLVQAQDPRGQELTRLGLLPAREGRGPREGQDPQALLAAVQDELVTLPADRGLLERVARDHPLTPRPELDEDLASVHPDDDALHDLEGVGAVLGERLVRSGLGHGGVPRGRWSRGWGGDDQCLGSSRRVAGIGAIRSKGPSRRSSSASRTRERVV